MTYLLSFYMYLKARGLGRDPVSNFSKHERALSPNRNWDYRRVKYGDLMCVTKAEALSLHLVAYGTFIFMDI